MSLSPGRGGHDHTASHTAGETHHRTSVLHTTPEFVENVKAQICANALTLGLGLVAWGNYLLFHDYLAELCWAVLLGVALRSLRTSITRFLEHLQRSTTKQEYLIVQLRNSVALVLNQMFRSVKSDYYAVRTTGRKKQSKNGTVGAKTENRAALPFLVILAVIIALNFHLFPWYTVVLTIVIYLVVMYVVLLIIKYKYIAGKQTMASMVSITLLFGLTLIAAFMAVFFAYECLLEGQKAVTQLYNWSESFRNDAVGAHFEEMKKLALVNAGAMKETLQNTPIYRTWGPIVETLRHHAEKNATSWSDWQFHLKTLSSQFFGNSSANGNTTIATTAAITPSAFNLAPNTTFLIEEAFPVIKDTIGRILGGGSAILSLLRDVLLVIVLTITDWGFRIVMFFAVLYQFLVHKENLVKEWVRDLIALVSFPSDSELGPANFEDKWANLTTTLHSIFIRPLRVSVLSSAIKFLVFYAAGIEFCFSATFLRFIMSLFPLIAVKWSVTPWLVVYVGRLIYALHVPKTPVYDLVVVIIQVVLIAALIVGDRSEPAGSLYDYLLGLSAYLGLPAFGFQGVLLGPLLLSLVVFAKDLVLPATKSPQDTRRGKGNGSKPAVARASPHRSVRDREDSLMDDDIAGLLDSDEDGTTTTTTTNIGTAGGRGLQRKKERIRLRKRATMGRHPATSPDIS